jgi:outer membrane PBP1 activator LpoA protein
MDQSRAAWVIIPSMSERSCQRRIAGRPPRRVRALLRLAAVLLPAVVLLVGCQVPGGRVETTREPPARQAPVEERGDSAQAARDWEAQARAAEPGMAGPLWISAADAWARAGETERARQSLRRVDRGTLLASDRARLGLVLADLALQGDRPDEAEALLHSAEPMLPAESRDRYEDLYARLLARLAGPTSRELARAAEIGRTMSYYNPDAALEIMQLLEGVSTAELTLRAANPRAERQLAGWLDLAAVIRANLARPERIEQQVDEWKERHTAHPLTRAQALDTFLRYRQGFAPPARIAVLLPGAGRLQAAGDALRDGLMSAYLDDPKGSELLFFATDDDPESSIAAYFSALEAGVDLIIGPLRKESVASLLNLPGMTTPVLALNDLPDGWSGLPGLDGRIHGLSLSQDAEAAAAARHAAASGLDRALVMTPESAWGERMASAFEGEFLRDDREIIAALRFVESENDHSAMLERALKIDESEARKRQIENTLQTRVAFEPVRRDDVDVIFLAASAEQARLIRPQLRFHDAGDIPVYAAGRVYSGQPDPIRNQDLDGIRFPTTDWQLSHPKADDLPELSSLRGGSLAALYALGQDAWDILPWLTLMNRDPAFVFPGASGRYRVGLDGLLAREPAWAEFRGGVPQPLPEPAGPLESTRGPFAARTEVAGPPAMTGD